VQEHRLLEAAVIFAGYPQTKCPHVHKSSAQELIAIHNCRICMVHMASDECCGVQQFPFWHAEFERHMADQSRQSSLLSLTLPGSHSTAHPIWLNWEVRAHPVFNQWFEMMWERLVLRH